MRARCRRLLAILDGEPAGARGQSLVELALTMPILLVMLLGLVEVGWFANNYMVLLDNVREAGRRGAVLDPIENWLPDEENNYHRMDCEDTTQYFNSLRGEAYSSDPNPAAALLSGWPHKDLTPYGYSARTEGPYGFYDELACLIVNNMPPLEFKHADDDIVISVFSYAVLYRDDPARARVKVVGRYPPRANECSDEPYDPFDWRGGGALDSPPDGDATDPGEMDHGSVSAYYSDPGAENVRGYVFRGNHVVFDNPADGKPCIGSNFTTAEVEDMLNFPGASAAERAQKLAEMNKFGMVLVEMFWKHEQLLGLPWFNLGPLGDGPTIHVWTFFPVSGAEPDLGAAGLFDPNVR